MSHSHILNPPTKSPTQAAANHTSPGGISAPAVTPVFSSHPVQFVLVDTPQGTVETDGLSTAELERLVKEMESLIAGQKVPTVWEKEYQKASAALMRRNFFGGQQLAPPPVVVQQQQISLKKQSGRVYNKGKRDESLGKFFTRMILVEINQKYQGMDVHISVFPRDIMQDAWNREFNEMSQYVNSRQATDHANSVAGDIADLNAVDFDEFHVTFGHGSTSIHHVFFNLQGGVKEGSDDQGVLAFAKQVADWFLP